LIVPTSPHQKCRRPLSVATPPFLICPPCLPVSLSPCHSQLLTSSSNSLRPPLWSRRVVQCIHTGVCVAGVFVTIPVSVSVSLPLSSVQHVPLYRLICSAGRSVCHTYRRVASGASPPPPLSTPRPLSPPDKRTTGRPDCSRRRRARADDERPCWLTPCSGRPPPTQDSGVSGQSRKRVTAQHSTRLHKRHTLIRERGVYLPVSCFRAHPGARGPGRRRSGWGGLGAGGWGKRASPLDVCCPAPRNRSEKSD